MTSITNELMEKQVALEAMMQGHGQDRYWNRINKAKEKHQESSTSYGKRLMAAAVQPMSEAIARFLDEGTGKPGRKHIALKYLRQVNPDVAAFIVARQVLDNITRKNLLQRIAVSIGLALEQECRWRVFEDESKPLFRVVREGVKNATSQRHKTVVMTHAMNRAGVEFENWPQTDKLHLGQKCIELFIEATGFAQLLSVPEGKVIYRGRKKSNKRTSVYVLAATDKLMEWIDQRNTRCELLAPVHLPCVIPPRDWTHPFSGGYHTNAIPQLKLVKTSQQGYLEELKNRVDEMPAVYDAINLLQRTAWAVNAKVLAVADEVWDRDSGIGDMPPRENLPTPPKPDLDLDHREAWSEEDSLTWKDWKRRASKVHEFNATITSKRLQVAKTLWIADLFKDEAAMYFPYQYDFRGRVYAVPYYLTPQGTDLSKALLTFAEAKPITTMEQANWLAIHGANVFGYDKSSLDERVAWAEEHTEEVRAVAADPFSHDLWVQADKPWQFLAWCFEWAAFMDAEEKGEEFMSSLPIAMDGTCNGLQIFSLVLRDAVGGAAVNLLPGDKPADIYQVVADKVTTKLEWFAVHGQDKKNKGGKLMYNEQLMASEWLDFGIDRKCTKRPVMVLPYGGKLFSTRQYIEDYIRERAAHNDEHPWGDDLYPARTFLADLVWEAIGETVIAARQCMDWLQDAAKVAASEGLPVTWSTPDGFPVLQAYPELNAKRVKTMLGDTVIKLSLREENHQALDKLRQQNGISPNWVHSLDGCALRVTVCRAAEREGVSSFAMVHDSYGTHAADSPALARCLREAFVTTFTENDVLGDFKANIVALVSEKNAKKLTSLPPMGDLDIAQVLESPFFFA